MHALFIHTANIFYPPNVTFHFLRIQLNNKKKKLTHSGMIFSVLRLKYDHSSKCFQPKEQLHPGKQLDVELMLVIFLCLPLLFPSSDSQATHIPHKQVGKASSWQSTLTLFCQARYESYMCFPQDFSMHDIRAEALQYCRSRNTRTCNPMLTQITRSEQVREDTKEKESTVEECVEGREKKKECEELTVLEGAARVSISSWVTQTLPDG